jgi:lipopolysaccharide biosynthesis protein
MTEHGKPAQQRTLAFYLPQFHPIPENDEWWGPGFTEWTNVVKGQPRFRGHHQPQLPGDLGFYDLRLPDTREAQAALARSHGIDGFVYYHYWFSGRRLLERPFNEVLDSGRPDFPFCLCWANENWTRRWDGMESSVLVQQTYGEDDDCRHGGWLARAFSDERYIRLDGKPLLLVYRASAMSDPRRTTRIWRDEARRAGVGEIFLCRVESFPNEHTDPTALGFDAAVEFAPDWTVLRPGWRGIAKAIARRSGLVKGERDHIYEYADLVRWMNSKPDPSYLRFPCVAPAWDNSARRKSGAVIFRGSTPEHYGKWLRAASFRAPATPSGESLVFVNAWNEWGEGCYLEPSQNWNRAYLEVHRAVRLAIETEPTSATVRCA